jgi:hypothetical protein
MDPGMLHDPELAVETTAEVRVVIQMAGDRVEEVTPAEDARPAEALGVAVEAVAEAIRAVEVDVLVAGAVLAEVEAAEVVGVAKAAAGSRRPVMRLAYSVWR